MKLLIALIPAVLTAATVPQNFVVITDTSGSTQTTRPVSISRVFAQGEIPNYAQPSINGTPLSTWQCDRKTSWADTSMAHGIISFTVTIPANGSVRVDFVNNVNPSSAGNLAATQAAALNGAGMLAFNSTNWNAAITTTLTNGGSPTGQVDARTMITANNFRYWLQGPVVTEVIAEDRTTSRTYDMGLDTNKSIHPFFVLTFYPGWTGVKEQFIGENVWLQYLQDQTYTITLKSGGSLGTTQFGPTSYQHCWQSRWREVFWDGSAPGAVKIDYNRPYIIYSKAVVNFDQSHLPTSTDITNEENYFTGSDQGALAYGAHAQYLQDLPSTGGRPDLGIMPRWFATYLFSFTSGMYNALLGYGGVSAYVPIHVRESNGAISFDGTNNGFGHIVSITGRPTVSMDNAAGSPVIRSSNIGPATDANWVMQITQDIAHMPNMAYVPYLITGDYYFLEEVYFWGNFPLLCGDPSTTSGGSSYLYRHGDWGYITESEAQSRGQAWSFRNLAEAAFFAPDTDPEKAYFKQKLDTNIAVMEGTLGLTTGNYYDPTSGSKWWWGQTQIAGSQTNTLHLTLGPSSADGSGSTQNTALTCGTFAQYMDHYKAVAFGHAEELGFSEITPMRKEGIRGLIHRVMDPAYSPFVAAEAYWSPLTSTNPSGTVGACSPALYFADWGNVLVSFYDGSAVGGYFPNDGGVLTVQNTAAIFYADTDATHSYATITKAAASFATTENDGAYNGLDAWKWLSGNILKTSLPSLIHTDVHWSIVPRAPLPSASTSSGMGSGMVY